MLSSVRHSAQHLSRLQTIPDPHFELKTVGMRRRKLPRRERTRRVVTNPSDRSGFTGHNGEVGLLLPDS